MQYHLFSSPYLPSLLIMAVAIWAWHAGKKKDVWLTGLGMALPGLFIVSVSVLCETGENMRYKFFLEPIFFVLIVSQLYVMGQWISHRVGAKGKGHEPIGCGL